MPQWAHAPSHFVCQKGAFFITAGTYQKLHHFHTEDRLTFLADQILELAEKYGLVVEAYAAFSNHYHVVVNANSEASDIKSFVRHLHSVTARKVNADDLTPGRQVWFQYRDTHLTTQKAFFARLNYVMQNPVRHGLVAVATHYRWCSATWFLAKSSPAHFNTVTSFPVELQQRFDSFIPRLPAKATSKSQGDI